MSKGIFGSMFDFNNDGKMSIAERAAEFNFLHQLIDEDEKEQKKGELNAVSLKTEEFDID